MNYLDILKTLYHKRPMSHIKPGLERISLLLSKLGDPHRKYQVFHVGGTNGKGSVTNMIASVLIAQGYRVGSYYSPHLYTFRERIRLNERHISEEEVEEIYKEMSPILEELDRDEIFSPSFFEVVTAMAFLYFERMNVEIAVVEVGLGGRLDATNVVTPLVSTIVTVDRDHEKILGNTIEQIAWEKAGIIKDGRPVVTVERKQEALKVLKDVAKKRGSKMFVLDEDFFVENEAYALNHNTFDYLGERTLRKLVLTLNGPHQVRNAAAALKALEASKLDLSERAIREGLVNAKNPGRFEVFERNGKKIILDGAHNPHGARSLADSVRIYLPNRELGAVIGILDDKDRMGILEAYRGLFKKVFVTRVPSLRMKNFEDLVSTAKANFEEVEAVENPLEALERSLEQFDTVLVTGSLFLVGYIREYLVEGRIGEEWNL